MNHAYVTSLELSQQLKEAGFPQDTEFWWGSNLDLDGVAQGWHIVSQKDARLYILSFAAPLTDELMEILPIGFSITKEDTYFRIVSRVGGKPIDGNFIDTVYPMKEDFKLCNSLAKLVLYLVKEGLLKWEK